MFVAGCAPCPAGYSNAWEAESDREGPRCRATISNNIFAKILRGELPSHKVYEDDRALLRSSTSCRARPGHALVIPKAPARQHPRRQAGRSRPRSMTVAQKIAQAARKGLCRRRA